MDTQEKTQPNTSAPAATTAPAKRQFPPRTGGFIRRPRPGSKPGEGDSKGKDSKNDSRKREPRAKPEFDQKIIQIRRVTRVVTGGRRFNFSVAVVAGNRKGMVGVGTGKAGDTSLAIEKAFKSAKKNMIKVPVTKAMSIPHSVEVKFSSARIQMMPAKGKGVIAGSSVRDVIELAGIKDVNAKILSRTKNRLNNAQAAIKALSSFRTIRVGFRPEHKSEVK